MSPVIRRLQTFRPKRYFQNTFETLLPPFFLFQQARESFGSPVNLNANRLVFPMQPGSSACVWNPLWLALGIWEYSSGHLLLCWLSLHYMGPFVFLSLHKVSVIELYLPNSRSEEWTNHYSIGLITKASVMLDKKPYEIWLNKCKRGSSRQWLMQHNTLISLSTVVKFHQPILTCKSTAARKTWMRGSRSGILFLTQCRKIQPAWLQKTPYLLADFFSMYLYCWTCLTEFWQYSLLNTWASSLRLHPPNLLGLPEPFSLIMWCITYLKENKLVLPPFQFTVWSPYSLTSRRPWFKFLLLDDMWGGE